MVSGLICGAVFPEQWGIPARTADFFDVKGDIENVIKINTMSDHVEFKQGVSILRYIRGKRPIFIARENMREHWASASRFSAQRIRIITGKVLLFELFLDSLETAHLPHFKEISKFPEIRRDIAILVDQTVPASQIQATIV